MKVTLALLTALIAAACGTSPGEPLSAEAYAAAMQEVEDQFEEASQEVSSSDHSGYPLDTQLVIANDLYEAFQDRVEAWMGLTPPAELAAAHSTLTSALDEVQHYVGEYLREASLEGEFEFTDIAAQEHILQSLEEAARACSELRGAVRELTGTMIVFSEDCSF